MRLRALPALRGLTKGPVAGPSEKAMEDIMQSITLTFTAAASGTVHPPISLFWLIIFTIAVLDDEKRRKKERRRALERAAAMAHKKRKSASPCP